MDLSKLVGMSIQKALYDGDSLYLFCEGKKEIIKLEPTGDCCARCFIAQVNFSETLKGEVAKVERLEFKRENDGDYGDVTDIFGYDITTLRGTCTIDMRTQHNGYYSGDFEWHEIDANSVPTTAKELTDF